MKPKVCFTELTKAKCIFKEHSAKHTFSFGFDITDDTCTLYFIKTCTRCAFLGVKAIRERSQCTINSSPNTL